MKRVLNWVVNIILIWVIVTAVLFFMLPHFWGWRFDAVLSGSMEPTLHVGGVILIKPVEPTDINAGDIIAFRDGEITITHRVIEVITDSSEPSFITKGDANKTVDRSPIPATNVVGEVFFNLPYLGYLAAFIKRPLGFLLVIFLPGLAIIGLELKNMWQIVLRKERAKATPEVVTPLEAESQTQVESEAMPPLKPEKRRIRERYSFRLIFFDHLSLIDKVALGIAIGAAATIIAVLATVFLMGMV